MKINGKSRFLNTSAHGIVAVLLAGPFAFSGTALAADERAPDEIVVQARKREESLQNIPVSGTVVTEQDIVDFGGIVDDAQLLEYLTGVEGESEGNPEYFIRGAGTGRSEQTSSATTQLRNGVDVAGGYGGRAFERIDSFDTQQVEVYRGAQGSLYGRNAVGGVINFVNTKPKEYFEYRTQQSWNFNSEEARFEAIVNVPLVENRLFLRAGLSVEDDEGLFYNQYLDEPFQGQKFVGGRIGLRWLASEDWDATLFVDYGEQRVNSYLTNIQATVHGEPLPSQAFSWPPPLDSNNVPVAGKASDYFKQAFDSPGYNNEATFNTQLIVNVDLPFAVLSSVSSVRSRAYDNAYDTDNGFIGGPALSATATGTCNGPYLSDITNPMSRVVAPLTTVTAMCEAFNDSETFITTQEFRLVSPANKRLQWLVGTDARFMHNNILEVTKGQNVNFAVASGAQAVRNATQTSDQEQWSVGVYGSVGYDIVDRLNVAASLRATYEENSQTILAIDQDVWRGRVSTLNFTAVANPSYGKPFLKRDDKVNFSNLSPSATLTYRFPDTTILYGSYAQAFRSGGLNRLHGTTLAGAPVPQKYDPETADSYEIGAKGSIRGGRDVLRWALAVYRVNYHDFLQSTLVFQGIDPGVIDPLASTGDVVSDFAVYNIGDAYAQGVEADFSGLFADPFNLGGRLSWSGGLTYGESKVTSGPQEGRELNYVRTWTYNGNFTYRRPFPFLENTGLGLFINTNFKWNIDTDNTFSNRGVDTQKSWNLRAGIEGDSFGQDWSLQAFWNNWLDVRSELSRPGANRYSRNSPSTVGLRLTISQSDRPSRR